MKKIFFKVATILLFIIANNQVSLAQTETVIPPSNRSSTSLEKNMLFYADKYYTVTQSGSASLPLSNLFDGNMEPRYSGPIDPANPYVILIEGLPDFHSQAGAWIGWSTRYYQPYKFKVEVYNIYGGTNTWVTIANETNYGGTSIMIPVPALSAGKIRFTFYNAYGPSNEIGLSELFYIHPEGATAYDRLMVKYTSEGNVGIGTSTPAEKLSVNGKIRAKEIKVETANWPDYVFNKDYKKTSLPDLEKYLQRYKHLPGMPTATETAANGVQLGELTKNLLKNQEELTLHIIEQDKKINELLKIVSNQQQQIEKLLINKK